MEKSPFLSKIEKTEDISVVPTACLDAQTSFILEEKKLAFTTSTTLHQIRSQRVNLVFTKLALLLLVGSLTDLQ